jgi:hypothetical protein
MRPWESMPATPGACGGLPGSHGPADCGQNYASLAAKRLTGQRSRLSLRPRPDPKSVGLAPVIRSSCRAAALRLEIWRLDHLRGSAPATALRMAPEDRGFGTGHRAPNGAPKIEGSAPGTALRMAARGPRVLEGRRVRKGNPWARGRRANVEVAALVVVAVRSLTVGGPWCGRAFRRSLCVGACRGRSRAAGDRRGQPGR